MSTKSQQLDDHLDGEHYGEDHVEDVHDGGEQFGLLVMLGEKQQTGENLPLTDGLCIGVVWTDT